MRKQTAKLLLVAVALLPLFSQASNDTRSAQIDLIIGGAESRPLNSSPRRIGFELSYDLEDLVNCSNSNFEDVVKASFDTGQFKYVQAQLVQTLYNMADLGSLVGTALRKMYPDEYDSLMSGIAEAKLSWMNALQQCGVAQEAMWDATIGGDLGKQGKAYAWGEFSTKSQGGAFNFAEDWVKVTGASEGINIGGTYKGGDSQLPIEIPSDITSHSYPKYRELEESDPSKTYGVDFYFQSESELNAFIEDLVGSRELRICESCEPVKSTTGTGIKPFLNEEKERVKTELTKLVKMPQSEFMSLTQDDFNKISYNSKTPVDTYLIQSLKMLDPYRQYAYLDSWSDEIAIANVMERTLVARRILKAGLNEGSIARSQGVIASTNEVLEGIDYELDELERELRMSRMLSNSTSSAILMQRSVKEGQGINSPAGVIQ